jgi:hypothetical protein
MGGEEEAADATQAAVSIAASKASALAEIPAYTGIAAMEAASSVAGIPIVGPALATAAFAEMQALGASALAVSSAAGGDWDTGMGGLYQLHPKESVIPAKIASPMRDFFENGNNQQNGGGGGNTTVVLKPQISAFDSRDVVTQLSNPNTLRMLSKKVGDYMAKNPSTRGKY